MSIISEIAQYLVDNEVGTLGTDIFYSQAPDIELDCVVAVIDRSGPAPDIDILDIKSPMFQIFIRSKDYATGRTKLDTIRDLLHGQTMTTLVAGGHKFLRIQAMSEGGHIGINESNRDEFSINFMSEVII